MRYFFDISGPTQCISDIISRPRLCRRYDGSVSEIFPPEHLSSLQSVQSGGLETALARPLLSSSPPSCSPAVLQNTEIHCSGRARSPPAAPGPAQSGGSQENDFLGKFLGKLFISRQEKYRPGWIFLPIHFCPDSF